MNETTIAIQLVQQAGEIMSGSWGNQSIKVEHKGVIDPVSEIDKKVEALIVSGLRRAFPRYSILAEEGSTVDQGSTSRWIIDPLDGTTNYLHSYPFVSISIGLEKDGQLVMGVVYNPILDELYVAEDGGGATLNGIPINVSTSPQLGGAVLASGFPYDAWTVEENNSREWAAFVKRCMSLRCDGSAALDMCHVACGRVDGYWEKGLFPWDIAAGAIIAKEAGAWVGDYSGGMDFLSKGEVVVANLNLARQIRDVLNE